MLDSAPSWNGRHVSKVTGILICSWLVVVYHLLFILITVSNIFLCFFFLSGSFPYGPSVLRSVLANASNRPIYCHLYAHHMMFAILFSTIRISWSDYSVRRSDPLKNRGGKVGPTTCVPSSLFDEHSCSHILVWFFFMCMVLMTSPLVHGLRISTFWKNTPFAIWYGVTVEWMGELGKGCVEGGGCGELLDSHHRVDRETNSGKYQQKIWLTKMNEDFLLDPSSLCRTIFVEMLNSCFYGFLILSI